jgi:hypothetical protein
MDTPTKLLEARNALTLCESLLLEAYMMAEDGAGNAILMLLESLTSDREAISSIHQLASLEEGSKVPVSTKYLTAQSKSV